MNALSSRYVLHELPKGFRVEGEERPPVDVHFLDTHFEARYTSFFHEPIFERFGLFHFGKMLEFIARGLMRDWRPATSWFGARAWAEQQTARALARRLREQWLRLISQADPMVRAVQRAIFASTFSDAPLAWGSELYANAYLVRDILTYPACAIAVRNASMLSRDLPVRRLRHSAAAQALQDHSRQLGVQLHLDFSTEREPDEQTQLQALTDWQSLFADTGESYRALNRSLRSLKGGLPHRVACNLRKVHLERSLEHRLEVLVVALYAGVQADRNMVAEGRADHTHLFQHAKPEQIREALYRLSRHLRRPLQSRRTADVRQLVQFLADCPEEHRGNIVGLTEKAIRWHRDRHEDQVSAMCQHYGGETKTKLPPIALPEQRGIRFLDTVGSICAEAERMRHCVTSYVDLAVQGNCYLFHVEYRGEEATVEVGCEGKVRQSQGPRNQRNDASAWGKRILNRWASRLPKGESRGGRYLPELDPDEIPF